MGVLKDYYSALYALTDISIEQKSTFPEAWVCRNGIFPLHDLFSDLVIAFK